MKSLTAKLAVMTVLALVAGSGVAEDSYLYWMVQDAAYPNGQSVRFDYATVSIDGGSSYLSMYDGTDNLGPYVGSYAGGSEGGDVTDSTWAYYAKIPGGETYESFLIELWTGDSPESTNTKVASASFPRSDVARYVTGALGQVSLPFMVTTVTPEPTSGLMLLLGLAALGLRRKTSRNLEA